MNKNIFIKSVKELNINIDDNILKKLDKYIEYLLTYNKHTNITRIIDLEDIYLKHFYDSLTIQKVIDLNNIDNLLDVGSGAGFPGMVIKIFYPHINVTLIDSNNKKTRFLSNLANILELDVDIVNDRVENYAKNNLNKFQVVTSRAVANLRVLSELSIPLVREKGYFIALKGIMDDTLEDAIDTIELMDSIIINRLEFNLYNNDLIRNIIVIEKIKNTDIKSLRAYDKIVKKPLQK